MNEIDILKLFYNEMKVRGVTRDQVYLNIDDDALGALSQQVGFPVSLDMARKLTDVCIANEWIERTTADPEYNFLSLTEAGLQVVLLNLYT